MTIEEDKLRWLNYFQLRAKSCRRIFRHIYLSKISDINPNIFLFWNLTSRFQSLDLFNVHFSDSIFLKPQRHETYKISLIESDTLKKLAIISLLKDINRCWRMCNFAT